MSGKSPFTLAGVPVRQEYLDLFARRAREGFPAITSVPVAEYRQAALPDPQIHGTIEKIFSVENFFIVGPTSYLPLRIYRPSAEKDLPAMVFFHGGGWVTSTVDHYDQALSNFANLLGCIVIAPTYQKAPEHPFPIPFDDCYATLTWVVQNAEKLGVNKNKIGIAGDSAGGNLAAAVTLKVREENLVKLSYQLLVYPSTDPSLEFESVRRNASGFGLSLESMQWYPKQYVQDAREMTNPFAWPALAASHSNLPPAIIMTAYFDVLQDDGIAYGEKLMKSGVPVTHLDYDDAVHGCLIWAGLSDYSRIIQSDLASAVKKYL